MKYTYYTPYDVPSIVQGHRPWSGLPPANQKDKPREKEYSKGDKPEEIEDCLWCWLPECKNCLAGKKRAARPSGQIPAQFQADVLGGMKVTQLARKYKVGKATISRWKRQLGLSREQADGASLPSKP